MTRHPMRRPTTRPLPDPARKREVAVTTQLYRITHVPEDHVPWMRVGRTVRLVSGAFDVADPSIPGAHPSKGWLSVCPARATTAQWYGLPRECLTPLKRPRRRAAKASSPSLGSPVVIGIPTEPPGLVTGAAVSP